MCRHWRAPARRPRRKWRFPLRPAASPETVTTTLTLNTGIRFTEFVEVNTDFEHTSFRDMDIELVSPSGSVSKLTVPFNTRHYTATYRRSDGSTFDAPYWVFLDGEFRFGSAGTWERTPTGSGRCGSPTISRNSEGPCGHGASGSMVTPVMSP